MAISQAQMRALEIAHQRPIVKVGDFIRKMWPDKVKPRDKISGGYVLAAMCLLRRMERAELLAWAAGRYDITVKGRRALVDRE